jgi:hypothetical protein
MIYDFEPPGRQERQGRKSPRIAFPGDPGALAVDFILLLGSQEF